MNTKDNNLEDRWIKKIDEIKKMSLSINQNIQVFESFRAELATTALFNKIDSIKMMQLIVDLKLALFQANNNYRKEFPSFWNNFSKLRLPNIDINNIKVGK